MTPSDDNLIIRKNLARSVIKQPLDEIIDSAYREKEEDFRKIAIIIEVNDEYYAGKEASFEALEDFLQQTLKTTDGNLPTSDVAQSIGSHQNPYFRSTMSARQIRNLVDSDLNEAKWRRDYAIEMAKRSPAISAAFPPGDIERYLLIRRIWFDHPINPLIDRSVSTVKADAARRVFMADGRDIVWAIIDSGIDIKHQHFEALKTLDVTLPVRHIDFTGGNGALIDKFGHGTHVAGIVAGTLKADSSAVPPRTIVTRRSRLDETGKLSVFEQEISEIWGMAPYCKLVSMKVLNDNGKGAISNVIDAIDAIQTINDNGRNLKIHGVNLSVGYEFDPSWFACGQSPVCVEVNRLVRSGVVVVVAAGNTGYGALASAERTTKTGMALTINDPGNAELAITVGSTHRESPHMYGVSYFSSKGPTGDGRLKPDVVAPGERILSCKSSSMVDNDVPNCYRELSGTSMAAPHVSGIIAALLSNRREYIGQPEAIKELFMTTATDLKRCADFQGRGLVDLMRALQAI